MICTGFLKSKNHETFKKLLIAAIAAVRVKMSAQPIMLSSGVKSIKWRCTNSVNVMITNSNGVFYHETYCIR